MAAGGRRNADDVLISALVGGVTYAEASATAGVSERTVRRRLDDADFRQRLDRERSKVREQAIGRLVTLVGHATVTLADLLENESSTIRLQAARAVLDFAMRPTATERRESSPREPEARLQVAAAVVEAARIAFRTAGNDPSNRAPETFESTMRAALNKTLRGLIPLDELAARVPPPPPTPADVTNEELAFLASALDAFRSGREIPYFDPEKYPPMPPPGQYASFGRQDAVQ